ncbi:MAG: TadE/TadG family type IV pilus assembly protein, partial [Chloroflexota bacterium]
MIKIIQLLDGTPAVYGKRQSGQSVVELALITPILIILLAGLVEIGWFANNYLNLLDVTRAGARRGAVLQDAKSPLFWDNKYSYVPNVMLPANYQMTAGVATLSAGETRDDGVDADRFRYRWMPAGSLVVGNTGIQACDPQYIDRVFYNEVICTMITTLDPLKMNQTNGIDDIIVSGFALQEIDATAHPAWLAVGGYDTSVPQVVVAGRYPTNANECDVLNAGGSPSMSFSPGSRSRDPFDINGNLKRDIAPPDLPNPAFPYEQAGTFTEIAGYDTRVTALAQEGIAEKQVGFSLFGNHKIPGTFCVGSEWTVQQVETLMNLSNYDLNTNVRKDYLPSQGLVLVEIYWEHEMLLKIPVLSPVFTAVGNAQGKMVINVWAAFPLGSV